jgi:hypothetical protein
VVAPRPDPQHDGLILHAQFRQLARAQRRNRHRAGIVLVGLVDLPGIEQPDPRGEFGWHIEHTLAGSDQLLREHMPQAACPFDCPRPLPPATRPAQQCFGLLGGCAHPQLAQALLTPVDRKRGM